MLKNKKMVVPGLVLAVALGGFTLAHAATKATTETAKAPAVTAKAPAVTANASGTATTAKAAPIKVVKPVAQPQAKLSQDQATKIALAAHQGAKLVEIKLTIENGKPFYIAKLDTAKGTRELKIGGNSGKIFKDTLTAAVKVAK